jgi:hypothetical protein
MRKAAWLCVLILAAAMPLFAQEDRVLPAEATVTMNPNLTPAAQTPEEIKAAHAWGETHKWGENLQTFDMMGVELKAGSPSPLERLVSRNMVNVTARHCDKYAQRKGFFHRHTVIDEAACASDDSTVFFSETKHNLRTNAGGDWQASVMGNTAAPPATGTWIALSNDATAPSTSDTVVATEIAANGLSRAQATYAHTGGTASYTEQKVFSATGTQASQKAGLLNASSSGTLVFENTYTQVTVNNGDTLTVTWTINY